MNKTVRNLLLSGAVTVTVLTALSFTGTGAIDNAKSYINQSYDLLAQYEDKRVELTDKIKELEVQLEAAAGENDSLVAQIETLETEKQQLEVKILELENNISNLEAQNEDLTNQNTTLTGELTKANEEIEKANTKAEELQSLIDDKDLSAFNPSGEEAAIPDVVKEVTILQENYSVSVRDEYLRAMMGSDGNISIQLEAKFFALNPNIVVKYNYDNGSTLNAPVTGDIAKQVAKNNGSRIVSFDLVTNDSMIRYNIKHL